MTNLVLERVMKIHFLFPVTYTKPEKEDMGRSYMYTFDIVHIGVLYEKRLCLITNSHIP